MFLYEYQFDFLMFSVQNPLMTKIFEKLKMQGTYSSTIKTIYSKPTAHILLNEQNLQAFSLESRTSQGCPLSHFLFRQYLKS